MSIDIRELQEAQKKVEDGRNKIQNLLEQRGQAFFQQKECEIVLEEFEFLNESDKVMKKVGPVLVPETLDKAKTTIQSRLEMIGNSLKQVDELLVEKEKELRESEQTLLKLQNSLK